MGISSVMAAKAGVGTPGMALYAAQLIANLVRTRGKGGGGLDGFPLR